ncbi:MAG TPA: isoamylase early set domain-containing protein [Gemmatimonadaceae bacterium]|nr:isoamylase early set domain-containing protein [Gemmatimonadaceae bacterium]
MHDHDEDDVIESVARELRRAPVRLDPALDERVMRAVRGGRPAPVGHARAAWMWLRSPRPLALSPLGGLAVAAGLVAVAVIGARAWLAPEIRTATQRSGEETAGAGLARVASSATFAPAGVTSVLGPAAEGARYVRFALIAPQAASVSVVGDFNDWTPGETPLQYSPAGGVWSVVVTLPAGRYEYTFLVNGSAWVPDPAAPASGDDGFGATNSVITVMESSS